MYVQVVAETSYEPFFRKQDKTMKNILFGTQIEFECQFSFL